MQHTGANPVWMPSDVQARACEHRDLQMEAGEENLGVIFQIACLASTELDAQDLVWRRKCLKPLVVFMPLDDECLEFD